MRVLLDTNRYVDLCRDEASIATIVETAETVYLPFVALAELRAGFAVGSKGAQNQEVLRRFLAKDGVEVLYADDGTTRHYATTYRQLRVQGTSIPTNDLWIAALVLQHDLVLCARDHHFDHLPQLVRA